jgi:hypothetical protein
MFFPHQRHVESEKFCAIRSGLAQLSEETGQKVDNLLSSLGNASEAFEEDAGCLTTQSGVGIEQHQLKPIRAGQLTRNRMLLLLS